ncbi:MAG: PEP-CTERM sorting domain-containing protein, partial [Phycisphaerae bacterium]
IGALAIEGDYSLNAGELHMELGGCDNSDANHMQYDVLTVAGDVHFAGTLVLDWVAGDGGVSFGGMYDLIVYGGGFSGGLAVDCDFEAYIADANSTFDLADGNSAVRIVLYDLIEGDADLSGEVDRLDLAALESGFGSAEPGWRDGDFNLDSVVDFRDYLVWKANFGDCVPGGKVPEPGALSLLCGAAALAGLKRRRS